MFKFSVNIFVANSHIQMNKTNKYSNFNFNVSHAGSLVVLGSEPEHLIGSYIVLLLFVLSFSFLFSLFSFFFFFFIHFPFLLIYLKPWLLIFILGVDVMESKIPGRQQPNEFLSNMTSCFTPFEWGSIRSSPALQKQVDSFFVHWCLKEAYIKAGNFPSSSPFPFLLPTIPLFIYTFSWNWTRF